MGIIRLDASSASVPKYWVNAPAASLHPSRSTVSRDLVAGALPVLARATGRAMSVGQRDRPVQRHPAHDLRVEEVLRLAAHLPDALVAFPPAHGRGVGAARTRNARVSVVEVVRAGRRSRCAAPSSSPYTSICSWSQAPLPTRTGRLSRQPARCGSVRSVRSCSPPTPNMICSACSAPTAEAAAVVMNAKKSSASSGQAATHRASMVKLASRTQE